MPSSWRVRVAVCSVGILMVLTCASGFRVQNALAAPGSAPAGFRLGGPGTPRTPWDFPNQDVCGSVGAGQAQCLARVLDTVDGEATAQPEASTGLSPVNLDAVYGFSATSSSDGETIALVDAYDDPNIEADLNSFDSEYGLAAASLTKVYIEASVNGQPVVEKSLPPESSQTSGWDLEISLDVEWAHAIDPEAKLVLVEAYSSSLANLLAAEQYAGSNATYVSNSWGSSEFSGESGYDSDFDDPGVYYFAAAGDTGGAVEYPSSSPDVISAGGTSLLFNSEGLAAETAWTGGGGGCSVYENANPAQKTGSINCAGRRATPDISVDADPNSGVAVYDTVPYEGTSGWWTVGGTSLSTVVIAAESDASGTDLNASSLYGSNVDIRDIVSGSNGYPARTGYDLATGVGSWSNTPGTITTLSAVGGSGGDISLSWTAPTEGASVSGYNIWIGTSAGAESLAATGLAATNFTDFPVAPGAVFYFEVQPVNALGVGPLSNEVDASASGPAPTCQSDGLEWCLSPVTTTTTSFTVSGAYPETGDGYDPMSGYRLDWSLCATSGVECYEPGYSCGDVITWQGYVTSGTMTVSDLTPGAVYCVFAENLADADLTGGLVVSLPSA